MKKVIASLGVILLTMFVGGIAQAQTPVNGGPEISFNKEVHDYGEMEQHGDGACEFTFTNTGSEPLIISNARGSCGCTVPSWPKEPIKPGESNSIKVKYDTKRVGPINKSVTIISNAVANPTKVIRIKGTIKAIADESPVKETPAGAPVNNKN